jgi:hypothetical protein
MRGAIFFVGCGLILISLIGMTGANEYKISGIVFIIGIILAGVNYSYPPDDKKIQINTEEVNKNIQTLNDALWGKEEKKEDEYDSIEVKIKRKK